MTFLHIVKLFSYGRGSFLVLSAAGDAGGLRVHTAQVWAPAEVRGTCSGRSKSRNLASNHGVAFRGVRAEQDDGKPTYQPLCPNNTRFKLSPLLQRQTLTTMRAWTTTMRVWTLLMRTYVCCACVTCVCGCAGLICAFVCWNPTCQFFCFFLFCSACCLLLLLLLYMSASRRPSSSQALYFCGSHGTTAAAHQNLPFVTAADGASVCACVRYMFPMRTNT